MQIEIIFFLAIKIWPLATFSHKLEHFSSKIAQWDSHWNCEKKAFLKLLQFLFKSPWVNYFYIFRKFKVWAWKCNKLDISIFLSSKDKILKISSNLSLKSQICHKEVYKLWFFYFYPQIFNETFLWPFYTIFDQNI